MDWTKIKAATIDLDVDTNRLENELKNIPNDRWGSYIHQSGHEWKSMFINKNSTEVFKDFKTAKMIPHSDWYWDETLDTPYLKELVESLPMKNIGMIRAFILNGPLVMHTDSNETTPVELNYNLGLTIATKMEGPMQMAGCGPIEGYNVLFNDSIEHGFPNGVGEQISLRIFGDFDYDKFKVTRIYE